jgi:hypothetical protein
MGAGPSGTASVFHSGDALLGYMLWAAGRKISRLLTYECAPFENTKGAAASVVVVPA